MPAFPKYVQSYILIDVQKNKVKHAREKTIKKQRFNVGSPFLPRLVSMPLITNHDKLTGIDQVTPISLLKYSSGYICR